MAQQMRTTKNITLEEAEQIVYQMVKQGRGYREISQTEFLINGRIRHFSPSQITKIKKAFEPPESTHAKDPDKALLFKLFKKGWSPVEAIIFTGFDSRFVREAYLEFLEFENMIVVPKWFQDYMYTLASMVKKVNNLSEVYYALQKAVDSYKKPPQFIYPCSICSGPVQFGQEELGALKKYLKSEGWAHAECIDKKKDITELFLSSN